MWSSQNNSLLNEMSSVRLSQLPIFLLLLNILQDIAKWIKTWYFCNMNRLWWMSIVILPLSTPVRWVSFWLLCQLSFFSIIGQHFLLIAFEQLLFHGLCKHGAVREIGITRSLIRQPALHQNKHCSTKRSDLIMPTNCFLSPSKNISAFPSLSVPE